MWFSRRGFLRSGGAVLAATALRAAGSDLWQFEGPAFGAGWRVRVGIGADTNAVVRTITGVIASVDAAMSPFQAESEISLFNRAETTDWLRLSSQTLTTIAEAHRIADQSQGAFDPTLGGLVGRYGFGPITAEPEGAFRDLTLEAGAARKAHPRQTLDLCGIAKGHALDRCVGALGSLGLDAFFVELGGEVAARGLKPEGTVWRAAIEHPLRGQLAPQCVVGLKNEALATSGNLINSYVLAGHRYGHIINPQRLAPSDTALASVSVFSTRAITADALATALFAMGPEQGPAFAQAAELDALFLSRDGPGLRQDMTGRFADRII